MPAPPWVWGLHSLARLKLLASQGTDCLPAWSQALTASSEKDRTTVRAKGSLAWQSGAGLQDLGILNQLLWQVWPAWLSGVHRPPGGSPASCWRVWGSWAGHSPRQQSQQRVDRAGGCRRAPHSTGFPTTPCQNRDSNPARPGPKAVQGSRPDLSLGLKPQVLNPTWEILTIEWGGSTVRTSPNLQVSARAGHPLGLH